MGGLWKGCRKDHQPTHTPTHRKSVLTGGSDAGHPLILGFCPPLQSFSVHDEEDRDVQDSAQTAKQREHKMNRL